jgi:hypothetical protein
MNECCRRELAGQVDISPRSLAFRKLSSWLTTVKDCLMDSLKGLAERLLASLLQEIPPGDRHIRWLIPETYYFSYYGYLTNVLEYFN